MNPENTEALLARIDERTVNIDKKLDIVTAQSTDHASRIIAIETTCLDRHGPKGEWGDIGQQGFQGIPGLASSKTLLALVSGGNTVLFIIILILLKKFGIL